MFLIDATVDPVKMLLVLVLLVLSGVRLLIFLLFVVWIRPSISWPLVPVNLHSETLKLLLNVWLMSLLMLQRDHQIGNLGTLYIVLFCNWELLSYAIPFGSMPLSVLSMLMVSLFVQLCHQEEGWNRESCQGQPLRN